MENVEDVRMMLLAVAFITDVHGTCSYKNVNQSETSWHSWHKKTFVKVRGVVLLPASAHIWTKQWKARRWPGNRVRANLSLHFYRQFVYPWFVYWFVILQGIKTEGVRGCNTRPVDHRTLWRREGSSHCRQSVYPHVVYSVYQLATTQVMFTTRCSFIPRLSPHGNQAMISQTGAWERGYEVYTRRIS